MNRLLDLVESQNRWVVNLWHWKKTLNNILITLALQPDGAMANRFGIAYLG